MKKLIVSFKSPSKALGAFNKAYKEAKKGKLKGQHYEIAFDNKKDYGKFVKNIDILISIKHLNPDSVYDLAKMLNKDQSNLNKIISFFESYGIVQVKEAKINNRIAKKPVVDYKKIEFDLEAA